MTCYNPKFAEITYYPEFQNGKFIKSKGNVRFIRKTEAQIDDITLRENITVIPCGQCIGCQLDKANDWATRCLIEKQQWKNNCFITLTYNDDNIPTKITTKIRKKHNLIKSDLQKFMKKLRKKHQGIEPRTYKGKEEYPIRYFCSGEYGDLEDRPHFHLGIFNWRPNDLKLWKIIKTKFGTTYPIYLSEEIAKIWGKGFITVEDMTYETACYIARYIQKKAFGKNARHWTNQGLNPEFTEVSRRGGIGLNIIDNETKWEEIKRNYGIWVKTTGSTNARLKKIPAGINKKWKERNEIEYYIAKSERNENLKNELKKTIEESGMTAKQIRDIKLKTLLEKTKQLRLCAEPQKKETKEPLS